MKKVLSLFIAIVLSAHAYAQDFEAPMITSVSVASSVDVTSGDQTVTATIQITDNDSGFDFGNLFLYRTDGNFVSSYGMGSSQLTSGDSLDGTYEVQLTIPQYAPAGVWEIHGFVYDFAGNQRDYGGSNQAFPVPADALFTVVNSGTTDSAAPSLVSVSVAPSSIDTGVIAQNVLVTVNITDALSGFRSVSLSYVDPNSSPDYSIQGFAFHTSVVSGDDMDGTYEIHSSIPQGSLDGTWTIDFFIADKVGNRATLSAPVGASFVVSNTTGGAVGELSDAADATQYNYATTGGEDWFPQSVVTNDGVDAAQSGAIGDNEVSDLEVTVTGPGTLDFMWKVDSEEFADYLSVEVLGGGDYDDISGDVDWTSNSVTIPSGSQTVRFRYEKDGSVDNGSDAGWVDQLCFSADSDMEAPVIQRFSLSPNPVDISGGYVEVTATVEVSDDFNGFSDGYIYLTEVDSGNEYTSSYFDSSDLISGNSKFGTYEVTFEFYQEDFDPLEGSYLEGTYQVTAEVYENNTGNSRYYGNGDDDFPIQSAEFFTVGGGGPSGVAPYLTGINSITPSSVDVSSSDQSVTFQFDVISNSIGFSYGDISVYNPSGSFVRSIFFDDSDRISGTDLNGTYSVTVPIYEHSAPGTWSASVSLYDYNGNGRDYPFETAFPNPGEEDFTVVNTGSVDNADPVLTAFTLSTTSVDTSSSPQSITVNLSLTDDLSGLSSVSLYAYDPNDNFASALFTSFTTSGELTNSYNGSFDLAIGSLEGNWNAVLSVRDRAGNSFFYVAGTLGFGDPFPSPFVGQFTVGPIAATTFSNFTSTYGLTGMDALAGANPDGDIYNNAMELLLGLSPIVNNPPNTSLYEVVQVGNELRLNFTIDPSLTITTNGNYLELSDGSTPMSVTGQTGANLQGSFTDQLPTNTGGSSYRVTLPITSSESGFMQLHFVVP